MEQYQSINGIYSIPEEAPPPVPVAAAVAQQPPAVEAESPSVQGNSLPKVQAIGANLEVAVSASPGDVASAKSSKGSSPMSSLDSISSSGSNSVEETSPVSPNTLPPSVVMQPPSGVDAGKVAAVVEPVHLATICGEDMPMDVVGPASVEKNMMKEGGNQAPKDEVEFHNDGMESHTGDSSVASVPVNTAEMATELAGPPLRGTDSKSASVIVHTSDSLLERQGGEKDAHKTPAQPLAVSSQVIDGKPLAEAVVTKKEGDGKTRKDAGKKKNALKFMFNIADGGFTELHILWADEKAHGFEHKVWGRHHDYWLLSALVTYPIFNISCYLSICRSVLDIYFIGHQVCIK